MEMNNMEEQTLDEKYDTPFEIKQNDMKRKQQRKTGDEEIESRW
jgi:hypothetical protein